MTVNKSLRGFNLEKPFTCLDSLNKPLERTLLKQNTQVQKYVRWKEANAMKSWADFKVIMPYANDLFGVYQPLLRWKSLIIGNRFDKFRNAIFPNLAGQARSSQRAPLQVQLDRVTQHRIGDRYRTSSAKYQRPQPGCRCQPGAARSRTYYRLWDCSVVTTRHRQEPVAGLDAAGSHPSR